MFQLVCKYLLTDNYSDHNKFSHLFKMILQYFAVAFGDNGSGGMCM